MNNAYTLYTHTSIYPETRTNAYLDTHTHTLTCTQAHTHINLLSLNVSLLHDELGYEITYYLPHVTNN